MVRFNTCTRFFLSALWAALVLSACAPSEDQHPGILNTTADTTSAVVGGQYIEENSILRRSTMLVETQTGEMCSGTLIASDILLIAAHCVVNARSDVFQVSGSINGKIFRTVSIASRYHKGYTKHPIFFGLGGHSNSRDIAVLLLRDSFPAQFVPASLPARELTYKDQDVIIAGYGYSDGLRKGEFGVPYFGDTKVSSVERGSIVLNQQGPALTCPGDSGGPVYMESENNLVVIGVHSWGNCSRGIANSESVGQHVPWLKETMAKLRGLKGNWPSGPYPSRLVLPGARRL